MKSEFQAKYLQHLVSKKKDNEGFTLIELLVVIIIVGVLAAIALPSFLNQIGKARGSEATSNLGTIHRGLQAFRLQDGTTFPNALNRIDARVSGKFFTYAIPTATAASATTTARIDPGSGVSDLKEYNGAVALNTANDFFGQVICESLTNRGGAAITGVAAPAAQGQRGTCNVANSRLVD
jgi:type IV pilus assembly protein PilA